MTVLHALSTEQRKPRTTLAGLNIVCNVSLCPAFKRTYNDLYGLLMFTCFYILTSRAKIICTTCQCGAFVFKLSQFFVSNGDFSVPRNPLKDNVDRGIAVCVIQIFLLKRFNFAFNSICAKFMRKHVSAPHFCSHFLICFPFFEWDSLPTMLRFLVFLIQYVRF